MTDRPDGGNGRVRRRRPAAPALARQPRDGGEDGSSTAPGLSRRRVRNRPETAAETTAPMPAQRRAARAPDRQDDDTDEVVAPPSRHTTDPADATDDDTEETAAQPDNDRGVIAAAESPARPDADRDTTPAAEAPAQPDADRDTTPAAESPAQPNADRDTTPAAETAADDAVADVRATGSEARTAEPAADGPAPTQVEPTPPSGEEPTDAPGEQDESAPEGTTGRVTPWQRVGEAVLLVVVAVAGSLPVLWVLGAVPWRQPTVLIESMFRGFTACALDGGVLHPIEMMCPRAGVPLGMYQLDGGLSYPLGGLLQHASVDPLSAWKWSVAALVIAGTGALYWLLRRLTGSPLIAICFVAVYACGGTLTGRSWNWYWNVTAAALLPIVFAAAYALYARAPERRLRRMVLPGAWLLIGVLAVSIEWQYAGLFATATATGAALLITLQLGWRWWQRPVLLACTAAGLGIVFVILRWRLTLAGIEEQFEDTIVTAGRFSVDVATFVVPDQLMTLVGQLLGDHGWGGRLVRSMVEGNQLWVTPYVGVLVLTFLLVVLVFRRLRLRGSAGRPRGFLLFLVLVAVACVALALGPIIRVAPLTHPASTVDSPIGFLYATMPLHWIRYPWTWGYLLHVTLVLLYASLTVALLRRSRRRWSLLIVPLLVLLALDFVSPQVLEAFDDPEPSIALAPGWVRIDSDDPAAVRFANEAMPELNRALQEFDEPVYLLPWGNLWITPSLGPDVGVPVRNVGIDRNVHQVVAAAPFGYAELKRPEIDALREMLDTGWASAVVMLDHVPTGKSITRHDHQHLEKRDVRWHMWVEGRERELAEAGYCLTGHSWFTIVTTCAEGQPATERGLASPR